MNWSNFVGTASPTDLNGLTTTKPWGNVFLPEIPPVNCVSYPPTYLFAMGSANLSNATISENGILYNAGFDLYRRDENGVDVDRYLIHPYNPIVYTIHFTLPPNHHLVSLDQIPQEVPNDWKYVIQNIIK